MENENNLRQKKVQYYQEGCGTEWDGGDPVVSAENGTVYWGESLLWSTWADRGFDWQANCLSPPHVPGMKREVATRGH